MRFSYVQDQTSIQPTSIFTETTVEHHRIPIRMVIPSDQRFSDQWHLYSGDHDINVVDVWDDYTGAGVLIGVVDDGVEYTHQDIAPNYDTSLDHDAVDHDNDAAPSTSGDEHGTAVAGTIVAANNDYNVVGVAYGATLVGLRIGYNQGDGPSQPAENFNYAVTNDIDILNNSWGYGGFFNNADSFTDPYFYELRDAIENVVENGRDSLGGIIVFAAGNSGDQGQDTNYHNLLNSRYSITVGATDSNGNLAYFSNPGASVLVVAPGQSILTVDRAGSEGYTNRDFAYVSGTSFAAPIVSGVAALMLEANADLGWRDVQEILALSATQTDSSDASWALNSATNWNGGGMHTSRYYGFGLVDAFSAVRFAETWTEQSTSANETSVSGSSSPNITIDDLGTITDTISIGSGVNIDHIEVTLGLSHTAPVDLIITLISPDGTESQLVVQPGLIPGSDTTPYDGEAGEDGVPSNNINFVLTSTEFWGETGEGTWTIRVEDTLAGDSGRLNSWSLRLWGDALSDDTTYYFTDEYADFGASDASRRTIDDADGTNAINAAPVTSNLVLDLTGTGPSTIAGISLTLAAGTIIHNAFAGDGNDTIIGNAYDNSLFGGRGNDDIEGGSGSDTVVYLSNADQFTFTIVNGNEIQVAYTGITGINEGTDVVSSVEFYQFGDTTLSQAQVYVLAGGTFGPEFTSGTSASFAENDTGTAYDANASVDSGPLPVYSISGGPDAALFSINTATGEVTFNTPPDYEAPGDVGGDNDYVIEITASANGEDAVQTVTISVTNENDNAPTFTSGTTTNFVENGNGVAFDLSATDVDGGTLTYSLEGGPDDALFTINTTTGEISFISPPDYENPADVGLDNTYQLTVGVSDGTNMTTGTVSIVVTDTDGTPAFTSGTSTSFAENGTGTVYDANATSGDGSAPTYSISGGVDAALFAINTLTGEVTFNASPDFESPADDGGDNVYDIIITADSDGLTTSQSVSITVTDTNDVAPVITSGTATNFAENGFGVVYDASATDIEGGSPTFAITGGADASLFNINTATGEVTFKVSPDYEAPADAGGDNSYVIEITASDGINESAPQTVTITVTDVVNEFNVVNGTNDDDLELTGTNGADQINGLDGNDWITGGEGVDQLNGGDGDDVFLVAQGDSPDAYFGGTGSDTIAAIESDVEIIFAGGTFGAANSIELITNDAPNPPSAYTVLTGTSGRDTIDVSAESDPYYIDGLGDNDRLTGGSANDVLIGGAGNDNLTGGGGADIFVVSDGTVRDTIRDFDINSGDVVNFAGVTGFNSFSDVLANLSATPSGARILLPDGGQVFLNGIAVASLTSDHFVFAAPPSPAGMSAEPSAIVANTTIGGTAGADTYDFSNTVLEGIVAINMGDGNDDVIGSSGADVINGEGDDDRLAGLDGDDTIDGGAGTDTAVLQYNRGTYVATQIDGDSVQLVSSEGTDVFHNVESFEFNDQTLTFAELLNINYVPVFTSGTSANVDENTTFAYDADATDADSAAPTYAITGGADASLFQINTTTGEVSFNSAPDFEDPLDANGDNDYVIEITASSGGDDTVQTVTITVDNVNDNNPFFLSGTSSSFVENGTGVAFDVDADDLDNDTLTYTLGTGSDEDLFTINSATGEISFINPPDFENPTDIGANNVYQLLVGATDGLNSIYGTVTITVTNVDGTPYFSSGTATSFAENGTGTVYDANAASDDGPAPVYSITGGADAALFSINTVTGEVSFDTPPDFEDPTDANLDNVYLFEVTANSDGLTLTQSVSVTVTDEPEGGVSYTLLTGTVGRDTLDASAETTPYYIEGLAGVDRLYGGSADDVLVGGADRDVLTGNAGADMFVITDGGGDDTIRDFDINSGDTINLAGVTGLNDFADVLAVAANSPAGAIINLPDGSKLYLSGVDYSSLSADDFVFAAPPSPVSAVVPSASAFLDGGDDFILGGVSSPLESTGKFGAEIVIGTLGRDVLADMDVLDFGSPQLVQPIEEIAPAMVDTAPWEDHHLSDLFAEFGTGHSDHFIL